MSANRFTLRPCAAVGRHLHHFERLLSAFTTGNVCSMNPTGSFVFGLATLLLCSCQDQSRLQKLEDQLAVIQAKITHLPDREPVYLLHDTEHKKVIGILKDCSPLQVGHAVVWDEDVYLVQTIRHHSVKADQERIGSVFQRSASSEVFVKFLSKLKPNE
jgi:hypothetical protein